jgi:2-dehydro-3-deoxyphosphogluconate aldolase/(4S)-4-hydroxy-2-oxoglutarate aldolase
MKKNSCIEMIQENGVIAIIRAQRFGELIDAAEAIHAGGLSVIEVTMTTPNALSVITEARKRFRDEVLFGAGTVLDAETARSAILAGAEFIVAPTLNPLTVELCRRYSKVIIPGCLTPTEILKAWELGANFVKVFPADLGGPSYIKAILAPLPQVLLIPTGGVTPETTGAFLKAGAAAVAAGSSLVSQDILDRKDFKLLSERAKLFREEVVKARVH